MSISSYSERKLTGMCGGQRYSINSPMISTNLTFEGSSKTTIRVNGTYTYRDRLGEWSLGRVLFRPSTVSYEEGEYGFRQFDASCYE